MRLTVLSDKTLESKIIIERVNDKLHAELHKTEAELFRTLNDLYGKRCISQAPFF